MSFPRLHKLLCEWWIPGGVLLFFFGVFWAPEAHIFAIHIPYILLLPSLLAALLEPRRLKLVWKSPVIWFTFSYLVFMVANSILMNGNDGVEFGKWGFYILAFVVGIGVYTNIPSKKLETIFFLGAICAATAGFYAIYRDVQSGKLFAQSYRLIGYANLYNELRSGIMFGAFSLFAFWYGLSSTQSRLFRQMGLLVGLLCIAFIILTGSRAPLIALASVGLFVTAINKRWYWLIGVIASACSILAIFWDRLSERGISLRPEIWRYVWARCLEHPWFGIGLNRHPIEVPTSAGIKFDTHNVFLSVLYQGGFIGLTLFVLLIGAVFFKSWQSRNISRFASLAACLQLYAIAALQFEGAGLCTRPTDTWILLWLPIALHWRALRESEMRSDPVLTRCDA